jgi:hypothetical protein
MTDQEAMSAAFEKHWHECWRGVVREEEGKTKPVARNCFAAGWYARKLVEKTNKEGKAEHADEQAKRV